MSEPIPKDAPGKPTITTDDHADNYGQRGQPDEEGTKPTITPETHAQNYGQRAGYHDHKLETESDPISAHEVQQWGPTPLSQSEKVPRRTN